MKKLNAKLLETVAWSVAGVVLCGALAYYNFVDKPIVAEEEISIGSVCPDVSVEYIALENGVFKNSEESFVLSENTGKVTILNFWDTWCVPCVNELPEFNELKGEYPEINIIAIVPDRADVIPWMNNKGYQKITPDVDWTEFSISFATYNAAEEDLYIKLGGTGPLPMTVIVDGNGVIVHHTVGSMHLAELQAIVGPLMAQSNEDSTQQ